MSRKSDNSGFRLSIPLTGTESPLYSTKNLFAATVLFCAFLICASGSFSAMTTTNEKIFGGVVGSGGGHSTSEVEGLILYSVAGQPVESGTSEAAGLHLLWGGNIYTLQSTGTFEIAGLVSHWKLDETSGTTAHDSVDSNNGTTHGVTWTTDGKIGGAGDFAKGDYIDIGNNTNLDNPEFTISAWINMDNTTYHNVIVVKGNTDGFGDGYYFLVPGGGNLLYFKVGEAHVDATHGMNIGEWYHVVATYNSTTMAIYINGAFENSAKSAAVIYKSPGQNGRIGRSNTIYFDSGHGFDGKIDEVRIYNKALSSEEVKALYDEENPTATSLTLKVYLQGFYQGAGSQRPTTVEVELCSGESPGIATTIVATKEVSLDATGMGTVEVNAAGNYYVAVKHKAGENIGPNHLAIITNDKVTFEGGTNTVNISVPSGGNYFPAYIPSGQPEAMWLESDGNKSLRGGDADGSSSVSITDYLMWRENNGTFSPGWGSDGPKVDFDGSDSVTISDYLIWQKNNGCYSYVP